MEKKHTNELIMQISKEIVVKFIETGRITPNSFPNSFRSIYQSVNSTIKEFIDPGVQDTETH